jgi:hypothetical protein
LLLRVFPKLNGHHRPDDFPARGPLPKDEFQARRRRRVSQATAARSRSNPNNTCAALAARAQIYTWRDATLRELAELVRVRPTRGAGAGRSCAALRRASLVVRDDSLRPARQAVPPAASKPHARLAFSLVYPDRAGRATLRPIGQARPRLRSAAQRTPRAAHSAPPPLPLPTQVAPAGAPRRGEDEAKSLHAVNFQTGDYLDVAIFDARG